MADKLDDVMITKAIVGTYHKRLLSDLELDVAIVGAGPSGLIAAYELARRKRHVAVFERKLAPGGGMWGGGIGYNIIVVQNDAKPILDELGVHTEKYAENYWTANSIETMAALMLSAIRAGAYIYNLFSVEDVMVSNGRICGVVINSSAIQIAGLHVDPVSIRAKYVVDATGHDMEVVKKASEKAGVKLRTSSGKPEGERSMNAELGEKALLKNTKEIAPGLFVCGMAANAVFGSHRMGPIFGGMLLSGKKVANDIDKLLTKTKKS